MDLFYLKFILTNIVFSTAICLLFIRMDKQQIHSKSELLLYSLGLGPVFTTLLLYYFFLFIPHQSNIVYAVLILIVYSIFGIIGRESIKPLYHDLIRNFRGIYYKFNKSRFSRVEYTCLIAVLAVPLILYLYAYLTKIIHQPLIGHDILDYGIMGRILFEEKSLEPIWVKTFSGSGYRYGILHAPSFSLLLTWEELINSIVQVKSDLFFISISTYYGLLIVAVQYFWVAKQNRWLAVFAVFSLLSGLAFYSKFVFPHIDTYRIFFFIMSLVFLAYAVKKPDYVSILLFGIFAGFAAFTHRIGVVTTVISCGTLIVMMDDNFKSRVIKAAIVSMLVLAFGGVHYMFDLIWGSGAWIHR